MSAVEPQGTAPTLDETVDRIYSAQEAADISPNLSPQDAIIVDESQPPPNPDTSVGIDGPATVAVPSPPAAATKDVPVKAVDSHKPDASKTSTTKPKPSVSAKPPPSKSNGAPPSPLVKKVIDSGTFGSGALGKSPPTKSTATVSISAPSTLRKSTSTSATVPLRTPAVSSRTAPVVLNRRQSVMPAESSTPSVTKPSLSASASPKPPSTGGKPSTSSTKPAPSAPTSRPSAVSPTGSATSASSRPRASVSEGVKRASAPSSKQNTAANTKSPLVPSNRPAPSRSTNNNPPATKQPRTTTSISSIREVREDARDLEALRNQLKEANKSLVSKTENVVELENRIADLTGSLETSLSNLESNKSLINQLTQDKLSLEAQVSETKEALVQLKSGSEDSGSSLIHIQNNLEAAKTALVAQDKLVASLRSQVGALEKQVESSKELLKDAQSSSSAELERVAIEHAELLQTQANLQATAAEAEAVKAAQAQTIQELAAKLQELQDKAILVDELNAQINRLKEEKEETSGKLSELEIEVLELKESQEAIEDERNGLRSQVKTLQEEVSQAFGDVQQARQEANLKQTEAIARVEDLQKTHATAIELAASEQQNLNASIEALKAQIADGSAENARVKADVLASAEEHARKIQEIEKIHADRQAAFSEQMTQITTELQNQEAQYNVKLQGVKDEHSRLLQETFDRAKTAAGEEHTQELQALRAGSNYSVEQVQAAKKQAIEDLKAEHESVLHSEINRAEKTIATLRLDLKATQDDLAKAKAALESARQEVKTLSQQRDQALAQATTSHTSTHSDEVIRLTQELSNSKDDLTALTDMLNLTKDSLTEMSNKQAQDLEDAARARAEEVTKLHATHAQEVTVLATQKLDLSIKVSDLEGELMTLKAAIASDHAAPKSNSNGPTSPASPSITKEELQRMYEAHNLKIYDLQAENERALKALRDELEASQNKIAELSTEVERKTMEIQYLEQDQEDSQEQINRFKEELDTLTNRND